jgi:hypothetical protein
LGDPYDPAAAEAAPPPTPLIATAVHDRFEDSPSSDDVMDDDLSFVKGSATHGDVHAFAYEMLHLIHGGRKAAYRLQDQLQAWAARCDKTTDRAIQAAIASGFCLVADGGGWSLADGILRTLTQLWHRTQWRTLQDYLLCSRPPSPCLQSGSREPSTW